MTDKQIKALYIADQFCKAGMTLAGAAGSIANFDAESGINPKNVQDSYERGLGMNDGTYTAAVDNGSYRNFAGDAAGYGIAQWTAKDRKTMMLNYFRQRGVSIGDFYTQVAFAIYEMRAKFSKAWNTCTGSNNPYECGYIVCWHFEIPANTEAAAQYRGGLAQSWYNWLRENYNPETAASDDPVIPASEQGTDTADEQGQGKDENRTEKAWPPRQLQKGRCAGWKEVLLLQTLLWCRGYNVARDGVFGDESEEAVKSFQDEQHLAADGIVGPMTWAALGIKY